jgi:hypothetical protein
MIRRRLHRAFSYRLIHFSVRVPANIRSFTGSMQRAMTQKS